MELKEFPAVVNDGTELGEKYGKPKMVYLKENVQKLIHEYEAKINDLEYRNEMQSATIRQLTIELAEKD